MVAKKILIIGNSCGGKSLLAKKLSQKHHLQVLNIDSLQFNFDLTIKPYNQTIEKIQTFQNSHDQWIIDGYGPLDILIKTVSISDRVILIDWPLWHHYAWATVRLMNLIFRRREELKDHRSEFDWMHIKKLFRSIHQHEKLMKPELLRILQRDEHRDKLIHIKSRSQLKKLM